MKTKPEFDGPIPGEHFLSDKRNYPWHRPPQIKSYNGTVEYVMGRLDDEQTSELVFSLIQMERPLTNIVASLMLQGVSKGKFQIDMALLAAGPVYRYIKMIADKEGFKYNDGFSDKRTPITPTTLKLAMGIIDPIDDAEEVSETPAEPVTMPEGGLMGRPSADDLEIAPVDEQEAMLGMLEEEEETDVV